MCHYLGSEIADETIGYWVKQRFTNHYKLDSVLTLCREEY